MTPFTPPPQPTLPRDQLTSDRERERNEKKPFLSIATAYGEGDENATLIFRNDLGRAMKNDG